MCQDAFAAHCGVTSAEMRFLFDGEEISGQLPSLLEVGGGDEGRMLCMHMCVL